MIVGSKGTSWIQEPPSKVAEDGGWSLLHRGLHTGGQLPLLTEIQRLRSCLTTYHHRLKLVVPCVRQLDGQSCVIAGSWTFKEKEFVR